MPLSGLHHAAGHAALAALIAGVLAIACEGSSADDPGTAVPDHANGGSGGGPFGGSGGRVTGSTGGATCGGCSAPAVCDTPEMHDPCSCGCFVPGEIERHGDGVVFRCTERGCLEMELTHCTGSDPTGTTGPVIPQCPCAVPEGEYCCTDEGAPVSGYACTAGKWSEGFWGYPCGGFPDDSGPPDGAVPGGIVCGGVR